MLKNCVLKPSVSTEKWMKAAGIRAVKTMADRDRHDRHRSIYLGHRLEDGRISIGCSRFSIAAHQRSGHSGSKGGVITYEI